MNIQVDILLQLVVDLVLMLFFGSCWFDEEFYFYLFEFVGLEDEVVWSDFVVKVFVDLFDIEWWFFMSSCYYVGKVYEDVLCGFWVQIVQFFFGFDGFEVGFEYYVEFVWLCLLVGFVGFWVVNVG